ncbi:MAG: hypothetical protein MUE40_03620 [Anaerolineae bacterium]|nr:hypothetical protein [Anaerolineae bacterium]
MPTPMIEIRGNRFLGWWLVGSALVYPMSVLLAALAVMIFSAVFSFVTGLIGLNVLTRSYPDLLSLVSFAAIAAILGGSIGYSLGHIQRYLLRRHLYWTADGWRRASVVGGVVGGLAAGGAVSLLSDAARLNDMWLLLPMPVYITVVSVFQWAALRPATRQAWLWVLANLVGGLVYSGLIVMNQPPAYSRTYEETTLLLFGLAVLAQGFITGFVMLWLFEKFAYPLDNDGDGVPDQKRSIWDEAI